MAFDRIVKGGNVVTPAGTFVGDVGITGEKISALNCGAGPKRPPPATSTRASGSNSAVA